MTPLTWFLLGLALGVAGTILVGLAWALCALAADTERAILGPEPRP